jgi:hypothetical protein
MMFRAWLIALVGLFTASTMRADFTYLAVGDSSAFGETDRTQNPSNGDRGYVSRFANYMATRLAERPSVMNVAINGETSKSFFTGLQHQPKHFDEQHPHGFHTGEADQIRHRANRRQ